MGVARSGRAQDRLRQAAVPGRNRVTLNVYAPPFMVSARGQRPWSRRWNVSTRPRASTQP